MNLSELFKDREKQSDDEVTTVSEQLINYIEDQLKLNKPFAHDSAEAQAFAMERVDPMARQFDGNIPAKDRGMPIKAPFLWGKVMVTNARELKLLLRNVRKMAGPEYSHDLFKARLFYRLEDIETYIGRSIPIRRAQREWLNMPSDYYMALIENESDALPFQYFIYGFDANNHQHFISIFADDSIRFEGDLIRVFEMTPGDQQG